SEDWGDSSGAVQHYLGVAASLGQPTVNDPAATVPFTITDAAHVIIQVVNSSGGVVRQLFYPNPSDVQPAQASEWYWDGYMTGGDQAPTGSYRFLLSVNSAYSGCTASWCSATVYSTPFY